MNAPDNPGWAALDPVAAGGGAPGPGHVEDPAGPQEVEEFFGLYAELEKERDGYRSEAERRAADVERLAAQVRAMNWRCREYQARLDAAREDGACCGLTVAEALPTLPGNLAEVAQLASRVFPRLVITRHAFKATADYPECRCVAEAWEILRHLSETLHPLKFEQGEPDLERVFHARTGYDLSMREGKRTHADLELMRWRQLRHADQEYDITPHVKHGNQEPRLVRVHFSFDEPSRRVVVGHIGRHLPNYTSKKRM